MSSEAALEETNLSSNEAASAPEPEPTAPAIDLSPETVLAQVKGLRAAVVVGAATALPEGYGLVIVAEGRSYVDETLDAEGNVVTPLHSVPVTSGYPAGADLYYRTEPTVAFPDGSKVLTLGVDVLQFRFAGFAQHGISVSVGPCIPAYAAANLAFQQGAAEIDVLGLTAGEKERLAPWFAELPTHAVDPAQVAVSIL